MKAPIETALFAKYQHYYCSYHYITLFASSHFCCFFFIVVWFTIILFKFFRISIRFFSRIATHIFIFMLFLYTPPSSPASSPSFNPFWHRCLSLSHAVRNHNAHLHIDEAMDAIERLKAQYSVQYFLHFFIYFPLLPYALSVTVVSRFPLFHWNSFRRRFLQEIIDMLFGCLQNYIHIMLTEGFQCNYINRIMR